MLSVHNIDYFLGRSYTKLDVCLVCQLLDEYLEGTTSVFVVSVLQTHNIANLRSAVHVLLC